MTLIEKLTGRVTLPDPIPTAAYIDCARKGCSVRKFHTPCVEKDGQHFCSTECASPTITSCGNCSKRIRLTDALVCVTHTDGDDLVEHFCSDDCANEFYLERLRGGL